MSWRGTLDSENLVETETKRQIARLAETLRGCDLLVMTALRSRNTCIESLGAPGASVPVVEIGGFMHVIRKVQTGGG